MAQFDYDTEQALAERMLKEAQALRGGNMPSAGSIVGSRYVPNTMGMMKYNLDNISGNRREDEATARLRELGAAQQGEIQRLNKAMLTPGVALRQGEGPLLDPTRPMNDIEENQRQGELGLEMMQLPKARAAGTQFVNSAVGYPEKRAQLDLQQQLLREQQASRIQAQQQQWQALEEGRNQRASDQNALRMTIAGMAQGNKNANADIDRQIKEARLEQMKQGSAAQQKEAVAQQGRERTLKEAQTNIDILLKEDGPLAKSTGSGAGRMVDTAAGFFGHGTEGAKNAASLGPLTNPILMQVPRFEGPQSDADTRVYKEAAGQLADTNLPVSVRMSAAKTIKSIMNRRQGQFDIMDKTGTVSPTKPTGPVDFGSLK